MKNNKQLLALICLLYLFLFPGCSRENEPADVDADVSGHTVPTAATVKANAEFGQDLDWTDMGDFEKAQKGFIGKDEALKVTSANGEVIWNMPAYDFMQGNAPPSVNPSLWRQTRLNNIHGLFKVTDGVYQIRGYDLANMTLIEGKSGWIIVDLLTAEETAARAMELVEKHLGRKPIRAIIFTHSHIDHFGGARGITHAQQVTDENIRVIAPKGFMEEATRENIIAGVAMGRRSTFMYGKNLHRSERGFVGSGLGKGPAYGTFGILEPNEIIDQSGLEKTIDGIRFIFQYAPETEAPAELTFYMPDSKVLCGAELASHNMHNLYTLRGAKIRDALKWSSGIQYMIEHFGDVEVYFGGHHWPIWGNREIIEFMEKQRDLYKYIHDQTVRLFNKGLTPGEIAEQLKLPQSLGTPFFNRGYYGTLRHNARAVYQSYLGWYDGNPANLNPLPPVEAGKRYVEVMGGADEVLKKAAVYFEKGEYRWVAEILNHLVFADPDNNEARKLLARTYDQLGYQAESGPWRSVYLSAADELRQGAPEKSLEMAAVKGILEMTPISYFFDSMSVRLDGLKAEGKEMTVLVAFTDLNESYELKLANCVLHHRKVEGNTRADATIRITHDLFLRMLIGQLGIREMVFSDQLEVEGSKLDLVRFLMLFEEPSGNFNIVTP